MNLNTKAKKAQTFDAIVIGSGISGGWAAMELTKSGLKTIMLERGPDVKHREGYTTAMKAPWEFPHRGTIPLKEAAEYPIQMRKGYTMTEATKHFFTKDVEYPYIEKKPFQWTRAFIVGGRSLVWGRQVYRWSDLDYEANAKEGIAIDWPVRYREIAPWYDYVEKFIGVSAGNESLPQLPDGNFQPPMEMNCIEKYAKEKVEEKWLGNRKIIHGRTANLTKPTAEQVALGRASCQFRNLCIRGCPYGAYFSTQSATLPAATSTGNLTLRPNSLVHEIIYDEQKQKATGVRVIDQETRETLEFYARLIFVNASTLATNFLMLNSTSNRFPNGLGNDSGVLGKFIMDHHQNIGANGFVEGFDDKYFFGRKATGVYVPRYRNLHEKGNDYLRGFGYQGGGYRGRGHGRPGFGAEIKTDLEHLGRWSMGFGGFGECLPYEENRVFIDRSKKDPWGLPMLVTDAEYGDNEKRMRKDMMTDAAELLEAIGAKDINTYDKINFIGFATHEMGGARMGRDSKTSILNKWNQVHSVPNVFVTDGSFMVSSSCVNPSLSYMAFTARAVDHALKEINRQNL